MRKTPAKVLALLAVTVGVAGPAFADFPSSIIWSSTSSNDGHQWSVRGIGATVRVFDPTLTFNGQLVSVVVVRKDIKNFCEFGWAQQHFASGYGDKDIFVQCRTNGTYAPRYTVPGDSISNGEYRFVIYTTTGSPNTYRFRYGIGATWHEVSYSYPAWGSGFAFVSNEIASQGDQAGPQHFTNIQIQNTALVWKYASGLLHMELIEDQHTDWFSYVITGEEGVSGDSVYIAAE